MGDMADGFRDYREHQRRMKNKRRESQSSTIDKLVVRYDGSRLTDYHFRLRGDNGIVLDIFPTNKRYHNLTEDRRGS